MLTAFNLDQLWYNTSSDMWNVKCENAGHIQNNETITSNRWICEQFNCKHLVIVRNLSIIWFNLKTPEFFFSFTMSKFLWNAFWSKIFISLFHCSGLLYLFTRVTSQQYSRSKIMQDSSCSGNTQKTNLRQFLFVLFARLEVSKLEFHFNFAPPGRFIWKV